LLKEAVPKLQRVAALLNPDNLGIAEFCGIRRLAADEIKSIRHRATRPDGFTSEIHKPFPQSNAISGSSMRTRAMA
jgi:hypothetical protein